MVCFGGKEVGRVCLDGGSACLVDAVGASLLDTLAINILLTPQRNFRNVSPSTSVTRLSHTSLSPQPHKGYQNSQNRSEHG